MANHKKKKSNSNMSTIMMVTVLLVIVGFGIFAMVNSLTSNQGNQATEDPNKVYHISYEGQPSLGDANAPVKLMEFGDFKCPHCKTFHDQIFPQLKKDFIDTGKVQMYFNNYAFIGEDSKTAAQAGESVYKQNNDAFWKFYDAVYSNQKDIQQVWATPEFLIELIKKNIPEVDANKVSEDLKNKTYEQTVLNDNQTAQSLQVNEVPKVFVNGKMVKDGNNYTELKKIIEEELKKK